MLGRAGRQLRAGHGAHRSHPFGNGTAIFTLRRRGCAQVPDRGAGRHGRDQRPDPVPMAYYSFGGWKASLFGDTHAHGAEGFHFFTRGKVVTRAVAGSGARRHQPGLPDQRLRNDVPPGPQTGLCGTSCPARTRRMAHTDHKLVSVAHPAQPQHKRCATRTTNWSLRHILPSPNTNDVPPGPQTGL